MVDLPHDYRARIDKVTLGLKCPVCNSRRLTPGENDLATVEPTLCLEYHPYLNDKQADEIVPSDHRLWWRCLANKHKHAQTVQNRRESKGCPPQPQHTGNEIVEPTPGNCSAVSVPAPAIRLDEASVAEE